MAEKETTEITEEAQTNQAPSDNAEKATEPKTEAGSSEPKRKSAAKKSTKAAASEPALTPEQRAEERSKLRKARSIARRRYRLKLREKQREQRAKAPVSKASTDAASTPEGVKESSGRLKVRSGVVVSDKAQKTIAVRIDSAKPHRRYRKIVRRSNKLYAHDENNEANIGDVVRIIESRPLSRSKRWRLIEVVERAK